MKPVMKPGVDIDTGSLLIEIRTEDVSMEAVGVPLTRSAASQLPEALPVPNVAVCTRVTVPFRGKTLVPSLLNTQRPLPVPGLAVNVATWHSSRRNWSLIKEHSAAHSVGPATSMDIMVSF